MNRRTASYLGSLPVRRVGLGLLGHLFLAMAAAIYVAPVALMFVGSLKPDDRVLVEGGGWRAFFPTQASFQNYRDVFDRVPFGPLYTEAISGEHIQRWPQVIEVDARQVLASRIDLSIVSRRHNERVHKALAPRPGVGIMVDSQDVTGANLTSVFVVQGFHVLGLSIRCHSVIVFPTASRTNANA